MSDEIGGETNTYHTHVYMYFSNPKLFTTISNICDGKAHVESARGSHVQNHDYVFKQGKWENTEKGTTSVPDTQYEWGTLPLESICPDHQKELLFNLINEGLSNIEILEEHPEFMFDITHIDRTRLIIRQEQYKSTWRDVKCTYIFGVTGGGKSRSVMEKYGYENVFRVTDYTHPFDTYNGEDVVMFEEFNSSFRIQDMLNYLDGYPLKLPARYSDKTACFTKIYITTNAPLEDQYSNIQKEEKGTWKAFLRRISKVIEYTDVGTFTEYSSVDLYLQRNKGFRKLTKAEQIELPFK